MSLLILYIKQALRSLFKSPAFTMTALLTLALGIGATTAMFATIYGAMLKPLPFPEASRLVMARTSTNGGPGDSSLSAQDYFDFKERAQYLQGLSALLTGAQKVTVPGRDGVEIARAIYGAHDLFQTLGLKPLAGRWFSQEEGNPGGPAVIVVGQAYARRRFGSESEAIGQSITVMGKPWTIIGVAPASANKLLETDIWAPMRRGEDVAAMPRKYNNWQVVGRLKPGVSLRTAQSEADVIFRQLAEQYPDSNKGKGLVLDPLQASMIEEQRPMLLLLMGAVGLVLLIACANVAGLLLARGASRSTELAVRAALGASRSQVICQLLTESLLLSLASGLLGLFLAKVLVQVLPMISGLGDQGAASLDGPVLAFSLGVSLLTGLLFGIMPALRASSENLAKDLSPSRKTTGSKTSVRLRSALVVGQVGLSLVLLVGSGMLIRSFTRQSATHPGFDPRQVLTGIIDLPQDRYPNSDRSNQFLEALKAEVEALPGVSSMSYISHLPVLHPFSDLAAWASDAPPALLAERETAYRRAVLPGYFQTLRIPLLAGRDFTSADLYSKTPIMILSQHMAKALFPGRNPLGQRVMLDETNGAIACEVVGVVGDVAIRTFGEAPVRAMYIPNGWEGGGRFVIRTTVDPESILQSVRNLVAARDRGLAIENMQSFEKRLARSMAPQKVSAITLSLFSAVALLLASLGLYGVLSYLVKLRTREIGIRTALGAQTSQVIWEITKQGLVLTAFGMGIGVIGSLAMGRILASQLYKVSPADPLSMALGSLTLGFVAIVATLVPALQAARVNPVVALRDE